MKTSFGVQQTIRTSRGTPWHYLQAISTAGESRENHRYSDQLNLKHDYIHIKAHVNNIRHLHMDRPITTREKAFPQSLMGVFAPLTTFPLVVADLYC
jgi:hypothetical protein